MHDADFPSTALTKVDTVNLDRACLELLDAVENFDECRLAGAVGPDESDELATLNGERSVTESPSPSVTLRNTINL
jgi:hypothetical protein